MIINNIHLLFFGSQESTSKAVANKISANIQEYNISTETQFDEINIYDALVLSVPIVSGALPLNFKEQFSKVKGCFTPIIIVATYDNATENTNPLLEINNIVEAQGFKPIAAAMLSEGSFKSVDDTNDCSAEIDEFITESELILSSIPKKTTIPALEIWDLQVSDSPEFFYLPNYWVDVCVNNLTIEDKLSHECECLRGDEPKRYGTDDIVVWGYYLSEVFLRVYVPINILEIKILNTIRNVLQNDPLMPDDLMPYDEMYHFLADMDQCQLEELFKCLSVDLLAYNGLLTAISNGDMNKFINVIDDSKVDMSPIIAFMKITKCKDLTNENREKYMNLLMDIENYPSDIKSEILQSILNGIEGTMALINETNLGQEELIQISSDFTRVKTVDDVKQLCNKLYLDHTRRLFRCWENPQLFDDQALYCINKINNIAIFREIYTEIEKAYQEFKDSQSDDLEGYTYSFVYGEIQKSSDDSIETSEVLGEDSSNEGDGVGMFRLEPGYFAKEDASGSGSYIGSKSNLADFVIQEGYQAKFEELVNELIKNGHISANDAESFCFHFTNIRCSDRPITAVEWLSDEKALLSIIAQFVKNMPDKYKRLYFNEGKYFIIYNSKIPKDSAGNVKVTNEPYAKKLEFNNTFRKIYPEVERNLKQREDAARVTRALRETKKRRKGNLQ